MPAVVIKTIQVTKPYSSAVTAVKFKATFDNADADGKVSFKAPHCICDSSHVSLSEDVDKQRFNFVKSLLMSIQDIDCVKFAN